MTSTPVFGEFLGPAGEHITAAVSFRGDLAYEAQCGVVRQIDRLVATLARYLTDLPLPDGLHPSRALERDAAGRAVPTALALDRAAQSLRLAAAGTADPGDGVVHPAVGHLSAAAGYLAVERRWGCRCAGRIPACCVPTDLGVCWGRWSCSLAAAPCR